MEHECDRRQAVRRARRVGHDVVMLGVIDLMEIDAEDQVGVGRLIAAHWGGDDYLAGARVKVLGGIGSLAELACRLDHYLDVERLPWECSRIALAEYAYDMLPVDHDLVRARLHLSGEPTVNGVAGKELRERTCVGHIVDRYDLQIDTALVRGAKEVAAIRPNPLIPTRVAMSAPISRFVFERHPRYGPAVT